MSGAVTSILGACDELVLRHVQVFFRHGARTPIVLVPSITEVEYPLSILTDLPHTVFDMDVLNLQTGGPKPHSESEQWYSENLLKGGCKRGQLTTVGQLQTFSLGKRLRKTYIVDRNFMEDNFSEESIFLRSTNTARSIDSLRCCLAGMFGADKLKNKEEVRAYISDTSNEILYGQSCAINCPTIRQVKHVATVASMDQPEFHFERVKIERALSIEAKKESDEKVGFLRIRDDISCREAHGLYVPPEAKVMRKRIERNATKAFYYSICGVNKTERQHIMRLTGGPILTLINNNIVSKSAVKMYVYSVHDWTILALLSPLGLYDEVWPPFAADLRVELYENRSKELFVQIVYLGVPQKLFGCATTMCPYDTFLAGIEPFLINEDQYRDECQWDSVNGSGRVKKEFDSSI